MKRIINIGLLLVLSVLSFCLVSCGSSSTTKYVTTTASDNNVTITEFVAKKIGNEDSYEKVYYVATQGSDENDGSFDKPFKTINKAKEVVSQNNKSMEKDICVVIRGGTYYNNSTIEFGINDSGTNDHNIIYTAYPGEKVNFYGGIQLTKWAKVDGKEYYYSELSASTIRYLYINGNRATLARYPNGNDYSNLVKFDVKNKYVVANPDDLKGANSFEVVLYQEWAEPVAKVKSTEIVEDGAKLNFGSFESIYLYERNFHPFQVKDDLMVYYQNAMEFLDKPGEFYYSKADQKLYYYPKDGENMGEVEAIIPTTNSVFKFSGTMKKNRVHNIILNGLNIEYTWFSDMSKYGYMEDQSGHYAISQISGTYFGYDVPKGAVHIQYANNIVIQNCVVAHTGGTGINFYTSCTNCKAIGNVVYDTSSTGIIAGPFINGIITDDNLYIPTDDLITVNYITISNNYVYLTGVEFSRSSAVSQMVGHHITITHNEIFYSSYSGISNGWGWSLNDYGCHDENVSYNNVHHIGYNGSDLGGIYNLNNQKGTIISYNYIHETQPKGTGVGLPTAPGIYLDEGTNNILVKGNQIAYAYEDLYKILCHDVGDEIVYEDNNGLLCGDTLDQSVIENAGLQESYKNLIYSDIKNDAIDHYLLGHLTDKNIGLIGFKFSVNSDVTIKGIGRLYYVSNSMPHKAYIYDSNKNLIKEVTINPSIMINHDGYNYSMFDSPITLESGKTYYIVGEEMGNGDLYFKDNTTVTLSNKFNFISNIEGANMEAVESDNCYALYIPLV